MCWGGEVKRIKVYYGNGGVRFILFFKNNYIVAVQRYKKTGEPMQLGHIFEK